MMIATLGTAVLLANASLGCGLGHHRPAPAAVCCDVCGVETAEITCLIQTLQHDPRWRKRDNAAHDLAKYDWHCHPIIPQVLITSLLRDCHEEVREEAAESLGKIRPCLPDVHAALVQSAECDPDHATRRESRQALRKLDGKCVGACSICGPAPAPVIVEPPLEVQPIPTYYESSPARYVPPAATAVDRLEPVVPGVVTPSESGSPVDTLPPLIEDEEVPPVPTPELELPPVQEGASPFVPPSAERPSERTKVKAIDTDRLAEKDSDREEQSSSRRVGILRTIFGGRRSR